MSLWRTKSFKEIQTDANSGTDKLERSLNGFSLILIGIGAIIGAGLFSITGIAAAEYAGPAIVLSFLFASLGCIFAGLCFSELAAMMPISGGAYSYTYATLGEIVAWIIGWVLILEYTAGAIAVAVSWSAYLVSFLHSVYPDLPFQFLASPWQPVHLPDGSEVYGWINLPPLLLVICLTILSIYGVKKSATLNAFLVFIKVSVVLLFIGIGFFYIQAENYEPFIPENEGLFGQFGWSGIMRASGIVFLAYIGFDTVSTTAQEVKNPQRNLPIGIIGSLLVCTLLYVLFALVMVGVVPYEKLNVAAPVALVIHQTPYTWLNGLIKLAIIAGMSSVVLVLLMGQSRIFLTMSKDGLLPSFFSKVHHKYHTPWISSLIVMVIVGGLAAFAPLSLFGQLSSIGTLLAFAIVCVSVWIMRKTHPELPRPFKVPFVPLIPLLGAGICLIMMFSLEQGIWIRLGIWIILGLIAYFSYGRRHSHLALK